MTADKVGCASFSHRARSEGVSMKPAAKKASPSAINTTVGKPGTAENSTHKPPPISSTLAAARIAYLHDTAARIAIELRALAVGDLNSSPYSPHYRDFLRTSGTTATTRYLTPTWRPLFLNLDHALVKNLTADTTPLPWQHSDHRPLRVDYR